MNEFNMTGKTVIVTGASYGLGVSWASALADYGAVGLERPFADTGG